MLDKLFIKRYQIDIYAYDIRDLLMYLFNYIRSQLLPYVFYAKTYGSTQ